MDLPIYCPSALRSGHWHVNWHDWTQAVSHIRPWAWLIRGTCMYESFVSLCLFIILLFLLYPGHCIQGQTELLQLRWAFPSVKPFPKSQMWQ